jgi:hypothetical protein
MYTYIGYPDHCIGRGSIEEKAIGRDPLTITFKVFRKTETVLDPTRVATGTRSLSFTASSINSGTYRHFPLDRRKRT